MINKSTLILCHLVCLSILLYFQGCGPSLSNIEIKKEYDFAKKKSILIYSIPSGNKNLDDTYMNVLHLDLQSRGYQIINACDFLNANSESITGNNHRQLADSLLSKKYMPVTDLVVITKAKWDSALVLTYYSKHRQIYWDLISFEGRYVSTLNSQVAFFDRINREPIMSFNASDTTILYADDDEKKRFYAEYPWMVVAKQFSKNLESLPICEINNSLPVSKQFKICFWVDKTYREAFPKTWKDRLTLRTLYANDIIRSQFNIEFFINEFKEWDNDFNNSLENCLDKLRSNSRLDVNQFNIGVTLDQGLKIVWKSRALLGLAAILDNKAVISAQPSFPEVAQYWNPIEEAITLTHEIGHLFGAIHSEDEMSIMFPTSGYLSFKFDKVNNEIITKTINNFFEADKKERVRNYLSVLNDLRKSELGTSVQILEAAGGAMKNLLKTSSYLSGEENGLDKLVINLYPDSAFAYAMKGYLEFKKQNLTDARESFTKANELDPDFAEVKKYLALIPENFAKKTNARVKPDTNSVSKAFKAEKKN